MRTFLFLILSVLTIGCSDYVRESTKKGYLGDYADAMVVCEKSQWNGEFGDSIKILLTDYLPAVMPAQGQLDLEYSSPKNFKGSAQRFRNIIYIDIGDKLSNQEPNISVIQSEYAIDQLIVYLRAKTEEEMLSLISSRYKDVLQKIRDKDIERKQKELRRKADYQKMDYLKEKKGYEIIVPDKYTVQIDSGNVLWMTKYSSLAKKGYDEQKLRDVVVTTYDYTSEDMFTLENLIKKRDEVLKTLTFNDENGRYKRFQEKHEPTVRVLEGGEAYKIEIRSMWTTEGAFEGGPSVQYVLLDYDNRRVIHADVRVYAPTLMKRDMLTELEAIIKSIKPVKLQK